MPLAILASCACANLAHGQSSEPPTQEEEAVGASVNYVFATDLGSGVYDLGGRTLQIYRYTYRKELRAYAEDRMGVRFTLPVTAGFFDFKPLDVVSSGPPSRVDSLSVVPGFELDFVLRNDWHLIPYARAGFSLASSSVDGLLYGAGARLENHGRWLGWGRFLRTELAYAGVDYRHANESDRFVRLRHAVDLTRGLRASWRGREVEVGMYAVFDVVFDPPTAPVAGGEEAAVQLEVGFTVSSRPRFKVWRFDLPRIGLGYRLAGELSAWRIVIGTPF